MEARGEKALLTGSGPSTPFVVLRRNRLDLTPRPSGLQMVNWRRPQVAQGALLGSRILKVMRISLALMVTAKPARSAWIRELLIACGQFGRNAGIGNGILYVLEPTPAPF